MVHVQTSQVDTKLTPAYVLPKIVHAYLRRMDTIFCERQKCER